MCFFVRSCLWPFERLVALLMCIQDLCGSGRVGGGVGGQFTNDSRMRDGGGSVE